MDELKPCPFCGGVAQLDFAPNGNCTYINSEGKIDYTDFLYIVKCTGCCSSGGRYEDINMAIDAWNKRMEYE